MNELRIAYLANENARLTEENERLRQERDAYHIALIAVTQQRANEKPLD